MSWNRKSALRAQWRAGRQTVEKSKEVKEKSGEKLEKGVVNPFFI